MATDTVMTAAREKQISPHVMPSRGLRHKLRRPATKGGNVRIRALPALGSPWLGARAIYDRWPGSLPRAAVRGGIGGERGGVTPPPRPGLRA